jgi:hypothetical protein
MDMPEPPGKSHCRHPIGGQADDCHIALSGHQTPSGDQAGRDGEYIIPAVWSTIFLADPVNQRGNGDRHRPRSASEDRHLRDRHGAGQGVAVWGDGSPRAGSRARGCARRSLKVEIPGPGFPT